MSMISELIEELIDNADLYTKELHDLMYRAANTIEMLSKKAREPKQGEWVEVEEDWRNQILFWECSECGQPTSTAYNFCPNCGCRMKGAD